MNIGDLVDRYIGNEQDFMEMFFLLDEFYRRTIADGHDFETAPELIVFNDEFPRINAHSITARLAYTLLHPLIDVKAHWYMMVDGTFFNRGKWYRYMAEKVDEVDARPELKAHVNNIIRNWENER